MQNLEISYKSRDSKSRDGEFDPSQNYLLFEPRFLARDICISRRFFEIYLEMTKNLEISSLEINKKSRIVEYFGPKWKIYLEIQWQSRERFFEIYLEMTKNLEILSLEFKKRSRDSKSRRGFSRF